MLHILATIALCIFIGERVWHYASAINKRRWERRAQRALYPHEPRSGWHTVAGMALLAMVIVGVALGSALLPAQQIHSSAQDCDKSCMEVLSLLPPAPKPPH